jgi:hypothetical protein
LVSKLMPAPRPGDERDCDGEKCYEDDHADDDGDLHGMNPPGG